MAKPNCVVCDTAIENAGNAKRCAGCRGRRVCVACGAPGATSGKAARCSSCSASKRACRTCAVEFVGVKRQCDACRYDSTREQRRGNWTEWSGRNPHYRRNALKGHLKVKYDMTPADYDELHVRQNGLCAICGKPETAKYKEAVRMLSVDHDHATGKVRGLLCAKCNPGLGLFMDDAELLRAAARYLEREVEGW